MSDVRCPVCGGEMYTESWFDEEGVEAWRCDTCGFGEMGDWSEPPDHSKDTDETVIGFHGETLGELRAAYAERRREAKVPGWDNGTWDQLC